MSFCREVTNAALGALVDSCPNLRRLHLWGCTQVDSPAGKPYSILVAGAYLHCMKLLFTDFITVAGGYLDCMKPLYEHFRVFIVTFSHCGKLARYTHGQMISTSAEFQFL